MATDFTELQATFKRMNPRVLRLWRWHLGWMMSAIPPVTGKTMVVTHTGRTSGRRLQTPANYAVIDGVVWATTNRRAQWLKNIQADNRVQVWLPMRRPRFGIAETFPLDAEHVAQYRRVMVAGGRAAAHYAGITPRTTPDADLLERGADYYLLRITLGDVVPRSARGAAPQAPAS